MFVMIMAMAMDCGCGRDLWCVVYGLWFVVDGASSRVASGARRARGARVKYEGDKRRSSVDEIFMF